MDFSGKKVLVTGASRGIGYATAAAFLEAGAQVAVNARTQSSVEAAMATLGGDTVSAPGDISKADICQSMVTEAIDAMGGLDVLVNNAGVFFRGTIEETDEAAWDYVLDANLKGPFFCSRAALPALKASKGNIVHVASESGLNGYAETTAYCASKGAVVNLTRSMAIELAPDVRVNCVCPGVVETDMARSAFAIDGDEDAGLDRQRAQYPVGRVGTPEEIAKAIVYLASDDAGFINAAALPMEGGATAGG
ncbi:MAG: SDR family oxidoreductase [Rhizobiales bacterium]|nr:SDR family oxidoreductase [Hyphomicrobiales bacterium]